MESWHIFLNNCSLQEKGISKLVNKKATIKKSTSETKKKPSKSTTSYKRKEIKLSPKKKLTADGWRYLLEKSE